jgi:hypothetical protein
MRLKAHISTIKAWKEDLKFSGNGILHCNQKSMFLSSFKSILVLTTVYLCQVSNLKIILRH